MTHRSTAVYLVKRQGLLQDDTIQVEADEMTYHFNEDATRAIQALNVLQVSP